MDEERRRRLAENEALYRNVNEQIEVVTHRLVADARTMNVVCECALLECAEQIPIEIAEYERIRGDATLFVVVPGHEVPDVEVVVEQHPGFTVVCKNKGSGRDVAIETDPRSG